MSGGGAHGITLFAKILGKAVVWPFDQVSDTFNANVDSVPEYTRRLQFELPLTIDGEEYQSREEATEAFKQKIEVSMSIEFDGNVSSDGSIAIHGETNKIIVLNDHFSVATGALNELPDDKLEIHFRNAETLRNFIDRLEIEVNHSNDQLHLEGQSISAEGGSDWSVFGLGRNF